MTKASDLRAAVTDEVVAAAIGIPSGAWTDTTTMMTMITMTTRIMVGVDVAVMDVIVSVGSVDVAAVVSFPTMTETNVAAVVVVVVVVVAIEVAAIVAPGARMMTWTVVTDASVVVVPLKTCSHACLRKTGLTCPSSLKSSRISTSSMMRSNTCPSLRSPSGAISMT
jgi:hypothetical protein